nr:LysE family translocator [Conchiformibius kuhniae]
MLSILTTYTATVLLFLIIPYPVNLAVVDAASRRGLKGALCAVAGTNAASLCLIAAAGAMLAGIGSANARFLDYLALVGSIYLIYYGFQLWRTRRDHHAAARAAQPAQYGKIFANAFAVGISNPKDVLFFMTFFPPFVSRLQMDLLPAMLVLTALWCVLDYAVLTAYGLGIAKLMTPPRQTAVQSLCALLFGGFGAYALWRTSATLFIV